MTSASVWKTHFINTHNGNGSCNSSETISILTHLSQIGLVITDKLASFIGQSPNNAICSKIHMWTHTHNFSLPIFSYSPSLSPSPPPPQLPLSSGPGLVSWSHDWGINRRGRGRVTEGGRGSGSLSLWLGIDSPQWGLSGGIMLSQPLHNLCRCCAGIKCVYVCVRDTERERGEPAILPRVCVVDFHP